jgi:4a-hydroxytetrahydrobiopterin dehydratase
VAGAPPLQGRRRRFAFFNEEEKRMTEPVTAREFHADPSVAEWRVIGDGACTYFRTGSFAESARLVHAISELSDLDVHPPDVDLRREGVTVRLITSSDDHYGISQRDVERAREISAAARGLGLSGDPAALQSLLVIPGAPVTAEVIPFWRAVLGYEPRGDTPDEDLVDPHGRGPAFWFEPMRETRQGGGAIHVAIWVPPEQAEARVAAALAAGGRLVRDQFAPAWWTLADAAGNEADIATTLTRD